MINNQEKSFKFSEIKVIIGLGNPGQPYVLTRHNIGFLVVDAFVQSQGFIFKKNELMEVAEGQITALQQKIICIKPQTFMNHSGRVLPFLLKKGIKPEEILVIHDELEKKFGELQIRFGGSARGHNGLKSLADSIGLDFWRLRFGIGRPVSHEKEAVGTYVLSRFFQEEQQQLSEKVEKVVEFLLQQ